MMLIQNRTAPLVSAAIISSILAFAFMSADERYVAAPGLVCVIIVFWLWMILWDRDQKIPLFDVGMLCAIATLLYSVYPLANYWVDGLQFGILSDNRLQQLNILPEELGFFHVRHVLYLFSFVVIYSAFRGKGAIDVGDVSLPNRAARHSIVLLFLILSCFFYVMQLTTGLNLNTSYEPEAYARNLEVLANLPLLLLQIVIKLSGILFVFKLALLFIVVSRSRQKKWFIILLVWIAAEIIQAFVIKGSRTGLMLFLMATALLYHRLIKPLSMKFLITAGSALFVFFIFLGIYRMYIDFVSLQSDLSQTDAGIFSGANEFQSLLGTAYDVYQRKQDGTDLPWYLYINDIITILPPQQLVPFEKVSASEWYLREIGMSGTGQGFMWGVISQSIIGLDWLELALRGGILGYILARFHRWYIEHQYGFLETMFYMYICLRVYYTFRDTTFSILAFIVWEIIPFYIILKARDIVLSNSQQDMSDTNHVVSHGMKS